MCVRHSRWCGTLVDAIGRHSFVCKRCLGSRVSHHVQSFVVARAFTSANVPVTKEPSGHDGLAGKRPDELTLVTKG